MMLFFLAALLGLTGSLAGWRARGESDRFVVGTDISMADITEFYYTIDASTGPPYYQRYRFYTENGTGMFCHETREGGGWPQTEADITASGTVELSEAQWAAFFDCLRGGTVKRREESLEDGDPGPWMYLYWNRDGAEYQEFHFADYGAQIAFEALCESLREAD